MKVQKRKYQKYTREMLEEAVRSSFSMREAMRKCGTLDLSGGMHYHISRLVKKHGISTAHFTGQGWRRGRPAINRKSSAEVLVYHTNGTRQHAVRLVRALLERGRPYKCFVCGLKEWRHRKLVLEIEHKDGDFQNDRESNLEFICPNCHSQTETFCLGLKKLERKKAIEQLRIARPVKQLGVVDQWWRTRDRPQSRKVERPSEAVLYSMVKSMPILRIAQKYDVSDNAIRKWAKRYGIDTRKHKRKDRGSGVTAATSVLGTDAHSGVGVQVSSPAPVL